MRARETGAGEREVDCVQETVRSRQKRAENDRLVVAPARDDAVDDAQVGAAIFLEPFGRREERPLGGHGGSVVERMGGRSVGLDPTDRELEVSEERRLALER